MRQTHTEHPAPTWRSRYGRLVSRFMGASVVATATSQLVFVTSYSLGTAVALATGLGWIAGAVPNFLLNRRNWGVSGRAGLRREISRFAAISVTTALLAAFTTSKAEALAQSMFPGSRSPGHVAIVWGTFLGTYVVMFVAKFFLFDRLVFTAPPQREQAR